MVNPTVLEQMIEELKSNRETTVLTESTDYIDAIKKWIEENNRRIRSSKNDGTSTVIRLYAK